MGWDLIPKDGAETGPFLTNGGKGEGSAFQLDGRCILKGQGEASVFLGIYTRH